MTGERRAKPRRQSARCEKRQCTTEGYTCQDCGRIIFKDKEPRPISGETIHGTVGRPEKE